MSKPLFKKHMKALNGHGVYTYRELDAINRRDAEAYAVEMRKALDKAQRENEQLRRGRFWPWNW